MITLDKTPVNDILYFINKKLNKMELLSARRLCILLLLEKTTLNLKEVLNLRVYNLKELETKGISLFQSESLCKQIKFECCPDPQVISELFSMFYVGKTDEDYAFTTIYNTKKPLYTSNVRKEMVLTIQNIIEETQSEINLNYLISDKII